MFAVRPTLSPRLTPGFVFELLAGAGVIIPRRLFHSPSHDSRGPGHRRRKKFKPSVHGEHRPARYRRR